MSIVPANAGSSESNSTACTTRTPRHELDEARLDDIRVGRRLARALRLS